MKEYERMLWFVIGMHFFLFGTFLTFGLIFFAAYFNPYGNYNVMVTINDFGEAHIELILYCILFICSIISFVFIHKLLNRYYVRGWE